ncbi:MAG: penicillin-binding protein activator [Rickettsiales bacterium]|nr:penicillin-binding protein activator [Rickettsiales bacterium]
MFIKRIFRFFALILCLAACMPQADWYGEYGEMPTQAPVQMQSGFYYPEYDIYGHPDAVRAFAPSSDLKNIAVLLPLSGNNSAVGHGISTSIEMAFLQHKHENISVTFHDVSGSRLQKQSAIANALAVHPDIVIGPVFAEDARLVREMKPDKLPVLSFTSDASAIGDGVMTMALIPAQSVEAIIKEMQKDGSQSVVIMAPKTSSGERMAGAALLAGNIYDMPVAGLFYYAEGNSDSIKHAVQKASMYAARTAANDKAREILSDILVKETLTSAEKSSINNQLAKLDKSDTLGKAPFDAALFLGNAGDTKAIASFLRYFDVAPRDARFYGTALWDDTELLSDLSMAGAKYAVLPQQSEGFAKLYEHISGHKPSRLDTFGFDAANLAIGMLHSNKPAAAYLLDPSGYNGLDGLFRLKPDGASERALQIVELTGGAVPHISRAATTNFLAPVYNVQAKQISGASALNLVGDGVNPMNHIRIPERLKGKYTSKTYGANTRVNVLAATPAEEITILPEDDSDVVATPDFQPVALEQIDRTLIDSVELNE